jgi:hypothetical protein
MIFHGGSETSTHYEARERFPAGTVRFKSKPVLIAHEIGYKVGIRIAGKKTLLTPYVSYGVMAFVIRCLNYMEHTIT